MEALGSRVVVMGKTDQEICFYGTSSGVVSAHYGAAARPSAAPWKTSLSTTPTAVWPTTLTAGAAVLRDAV